jgi:hypothetical protein
LLRKAGWFLAFSALSVVLMAASSPQCARTEDTPLSPAGSVTTSGDAGECIRDCAADANELRLAERDRFKSAMEGCVDSDCFHEEAALHVAILQEITGDERNCMSSCHNQGGGSGGN